MFNVCIKCGAYHTDKKIDPAGPYAICPECGQSHLFRQLPLFILTGASGVGKSSVCLELAKIMTEAVVMEGDILWRNEFNQPDNDYRDYRDMWLRVCKNISQNGKPVILCGSSIPSQYENCLERRYFSNIHYMALVCDDSLLVDRLRKRPTWRSSSSEEFLEDHIRFNRWFKNNAEKTEPTMTLLDTTNDTTEVTAEKVRRWIMERI